MAFTWTPFTQNPLGAETRNTVDARFTTSQQQSLDLSKTLEAAFPSLPPLLQLAEVQGALSLIAAGLGDIVMEELANPFSMNIPGLPVRPVLDTITVNPALLNLNAAYTPGMQVYSSPLLTAITAMILYDVQNGGLGMPAAVQEADQQSNQIRIDMETMKLMDNAASVYESMGWGVPPGALLALRQEAITQAARNNIESSNKILHESWKTSWDTTMKARELGIAVSKDQMTFMVETAKIGIMEFEAQIRQMAEIIALNLGIAEIQSKWNTDQTRLYTADGQVYDATVGTLVKAFDVLVKQDIAAANVLVEKAKIQFEGAVQMYGFQKDIVRAAATLFSQLSASWIGSATVGEHIDYQEQVAYHMQESQSATTEDQTAYHYTTEQQTVTYT